LSGLGRLDYAQERLASAAEYFRRVLDLACEIDSGSFQFEGHLGLGHTQHATGQPDQAMAAYQQALDLARDLDQPPEQAPPPPPPSARAPPAAPPAPPPPSPPPPSPASTGSMPWTSSPPWTPPPPTNSPPPPSVPTSPTSTPTARSHRPNAGGHRGTTCTGT